MRYSPRHKRLREQRSAFLLFLMLAPVYLIAAYPVVAGSLTGHGLAASGLVPSFAQLDRNHDGYVDSSEAAAYSAHADAFSRADRSGDGRLSPAEFAAALQWLKRSP